MLIQMINNIKAKDNVIHLNNVITPANISIKNVYSGNLNITNAVIIFSR